MDKHSMRYFIEHQLFPNMLYNNKINFVGYLISEEDSFKTMITDIYQKQDAICTHDLNDYKVQLIAISSELKVLELTFPEPEETPECYRVYMFFDIHFKMLLYVTVERSESCTYICSWNNDGDETYHAIHSQLTEDDLELAKVIALYYNKYNLSPDDPRYELLL